MFYATKNLINVKMIPESIISVPSKKKKKK